MNATTSRRALLAAGVMTLGVVPVMGSALPAPSPTSPDADLIADCERYAIEREAYEHSDPDVESEDSPEWAAAEATRTRIDAAPAKTLAGMIAKARLAKTETIAAFGDDQEEQLANSYGGTLAWQVVNDLIRLEDTNI